MKNLGPFLLVTTKFKTPYN